MDLETKKEFENIARIVKAGFDGVDEKFKGVDEKFKGIDKKLEEVKKDVRELKSTLTTQYPDKSFLTEKLLELGEKIDKKFETDVRFKLKIIDMFKKLNFSSSDIGELEQLVVIQTKQYVAKQ